MAYIYKITNTINNKLYIGKTINTIEKRFAEHIKQSKITQAKKRPLYNAINKYGIENFTIEIVEECDIKEVNEREKYWINYFNTYKYGYNATLGGDGTNTLDYEKIIALWNEGKNITEIAKLVNGTKEWISIILRTTFNIDSEEIIERGKEMQMNLQAHKVAQLDKDTEEIIAIYDSQQKAAVALGKTPTCGANIGRVCNGQRPTAYGYKWKRI